ncbi:MAG: hypothetical protein R6W67_12560, partial [Bacteroidales bacterium]
RLQVAGYRLQVTGCWLQVTGYRLQVTGYRFYLRLSGSGELARISPVSVQVEGKGCQIYPQLRFR